MEVHRTGKELLQEWENAIPFKERLQDAQETNQELHFSPCASVNVFLQSPGGLGDDFGSKLGLQTMRNENGTGDEGDFHGLFVNPVKLSLAGVPGYVSRSDVQIKGDVDKVAADFLVIVVVGHRLRNALNIILHSPSRLFQFLRSADISNTAQGRDLPTPQWSTAGDGRPQTMVPHICVSGGGDRNHHRLVHTVSNGL